MKPTRSAPLSRRQFLCRSAIATGALVLPFVSARNVLGANSRLNIAGVIMIGSKDTFYSEGYNGGGRFLSGAKCEDFKHVPETFPKRTNWDPCHYDEWLDACKGGPKAYANFDVSGPVSEIVLLGQLAVRAGQPIDWDAKKLRVTNVKDANRFVKTEYRKGWSI